MSSWWQPCSPWSGAPSPPGEALGSDDPIRRPPRRTTLPERPSLDRVVVLIPTYNERENLPLILDRLLKAVPSTHVLVADDATLLLAFGGLGLMPDGGATALVAA